MPTPDKTVEIYPLVVHVHDGSFMRGDEERAALGWDRSMVLAIALLEDLGYEIAEPLPETLPAHGPVRVGVNRLKEEGS